MDLGRGPQRDVRWETTRNDHKTFGAVILAVGFGRERRVAGVPWVSYWQNDDLAQPSHEGHTRYLISGVGDGGLIDVIRVRLHDFRHEEMLAVFASDPSLAKVKAKLLAIEQGAIEREQRQPGSSLQYLYDSYEKLTAPSVDEAIAKRLREGVTVVLNGRDRNPFSLAASILGRFLVSRLLFAFDLEYRPGEFPKPGRIKDGFNVQFDIGEPETFHRIVCRHGPEPALEKGFPQIWKNCATRMRALAGLDQTRWPIYADAFAVTIVGTERAAATEASGDDFSDIAKKLFDPKAKIEADEGLENSGATTVVRLRNIAYAKFKSAADALRAEAASITSGEFTAVPVHMTDDQRKSTDYRKIATVVDINGSEYDFVDFVRVNSKWVVGFVVELRSPKPDMAIAAVAIYDPEHRSTKIVKYDFDPPGTFYADEHSVHVVVEKMLASIDLQR